MPALYHLSRESLLPNNFQVIGIGRRIHEGQEFIQQMQHRVRQYCSHNMEQRYWKPLARKMMSIKNDFKNIDTYTSILNIIGELEKEWKNSANILFYLATSPSHFLSIIKQLADHNLNVQNKSKWTRIIVEKPFGLDSISAKALHEQISKYFNTSQIFNIDHFLGKEAVQNILTFRMSNIMFQPLWNKNYIEQIQIISAETIGVEGRVGFFEQTGAVRDMIQSHLIQILALLTMEHPASLEAEDIRKEKLKLLRSIRKYSIHEAGEYSIRGQYKEGVVNSELECKYTDEIGINEKSRVETYAAIKLFIDNERWEGVPIYLRTGKRMSRRTSEIFIQLKRTEGSTIPTNMKKQTPIANTIRLVIQPRASVELTIGWKPIGLITDVEPTNLQFGIKPDIKEPKAYERLLVDSMNGDSTLFINYEEIIEMWKIVDPIVQNWYLDNKKIENGKLVENLYYYPAGTWGPREANILIEKDSNKWSRL
ncbi:MAG: Glucose-6-phosphate 1-dehydrogenase [Candidatus Heimdallarchaeota archaeon LC_2]|nr:MAG: Glucose-6-phosphate 1-dehydrogenase [Candidatus Heimdallarchaeota archaeon LC_2]